MSRKVEENVATYGPLTKNLQIMFLNILLKCYLFQLVHSVLSLISPKKV